MSSKPAAAHSHAGAQPSILRKCLDLLPTKGALFIDIGCGKGRMLAVASEYPFAAITGIEIVPVLARIGVRNAARLAKRHPERTRIEIIRGDAAAPNLPALGTVVLFLYNPFGPDQMEHLVAKIRDRLNEKLKIFVVYYNPVHADLFDGMPEVSRLYAALHHFSDEELNSSPFGNNHDSLVIWQSRTEPKLPSCEGADRPVLKKHPAFIGEVQMG